MAPPNNIWEQMGYVPPRGVCNHKDSILSPKCPCLRFMIHPHKMSTSFECDGCGHHASYHCMENSTDNEIIKRWTEQSQGNQAEDAEPRRKKPRRAIENGRAAYESVASLSEQTISSTATRSRTGRRKVREETTESVGGFIVSDSEER